MKKESPEVLESYKIRIDALEIVNEAYRTKIEALEMLNRNLQFLRDAKSQVQSVQPKAAEPASAKPTSSSSAAAGAKRGRGRPKGAMGAAKVVKHVVEPGEKKGRGRPKKVAVPAPKAKAVAVKAVAASKNVPDSSKKSRRSRGGSITRLQLPLETRLREKMDGEGFNKATFRALTGILLCLFENGTATVTNLHEYIGGSRVTVVRHTATLKKMNLLTYEGSRKKGQYELTAQGRQLYQSLLNA